MKTFLVGDNDAGQRLDKFLQKAVPQLPISLMYKFLRIKRIKRNGARCAISDKLILGDVLQLYINDEFFSQPQYDFLLAPPLIRVVYEDENILLVDKEIGLLVHEDENEKKNTLINRIQHYLYQKGEYLPQNENSFAPALCNRIDRNTGGIVIAAKNFSSLQILNDKIKNREIDKYYLCVVEGILEKKYDLLKGYHIKNPETAMVKISPTSQPGAKIALTKYRVLASNDGQSLLEVQLLTGRTHQIRAHLAAIKHPLVGDSRYGLAKTSSAGNPKHQMLYSYKLTFSFTSDAGLLNYLNRKTFRVADVPFLHLFAPVNLPE